MQIGVFPGKWIFWYAGLLMIVSIDTIMWGRQIVLFFGQDTVVVETWEILLFTFFKKRLLLLKKHFETDMLLLPKNIFFTLWFYSTSSKYSYDKAQ